MATRSTWLVGASLARVCWLQAMPQRSYQTSGWTTVAKLGWSEHVYSLKGKWHSWTNLLPGLRGQACIASTMHGTPH